MTDQFRVEYGINPSSDNGKHIIMMQIWDENGNYYRSIIIGEYATFDRALEVMNFMVDAKYERGETWPWR